MTVERIQLFVACFYRLTRRDILGMSRVPRIIRARHIAMYLSRKLTDHSFPELTPQFLVRDHTAVVYGVQSIKKRMRSDDRLRETVRYLERCLTSSGTAEYQDVDP